MILVTGATGFLGMELLVRLLRDPDHEVVALIRAADDAAATARLDATLDVLFTPGSPAAEDARARVTAVAADLEAPGLGLRPGSRRALARDARTVVHCAASVSFGLSEEDALRINVGGTQGVLELAALAPGLERLVHVSTAYVAGTRAGVCREAEGDLGQAHRNTYESSKLVAEATVAESGLPHVTMRPSIVVGDTRSGWTPAFNVIYQPLQAFARGLVREIPGDPDAVLDIVPVNIVADALTELALGPKREGTFHVVAGEHATTARELADLAASAFGRPAPPFTGAERAEGVELVAGPFLPYFVARTRFAAGRGRRLSAPPPPLRDYFGTLMDHARRARWGKQPVPRWQAVAQSALA